MKMNYSVGNVKMGQHICRFCLNEVKEDVEGIDDITCRIFEALLLELNLTAAKNSVICWECMEIAKICLHFKSICLYIEELIYSFSCGKKESKFDIREIYQEMELESVGNEYFLDICRFCMTPSKGNYFTPLSTIVENVSFKMLPEVDFGIIKDPVVCEMCRGNLECILKFTKSCLLAEGELDTCSVDTSLADANEANEQEKTAIKHPDILHADHTEVIWIKQELDAEGDSSLSCRDKRDPLPKKTTNSGRLKPILPPTEPRCLTCSYVVNRKCVARRIEVLSKNIPSVEIYKCLYCLSESEHKSYHGEDNCLIHTSECTKCGFTSKYSVNLT